MPRPTASILAALGPSADGPTDAELLRRFADGRDAGAFELLVWRHAGLVLRICRGILRDHHEAEDAAQAVFLALARQAPTVGRRGNPAGWLFRVARRVAGRAARRRQQIPTVPDAEPVLGAYGDDRHEHAQVADAFQKILVQAGVAARAA